MRNKLLLSATILPALSISSDVHAEQDQKHPNIIMFLVDDMGWQDTSLPFWIQRTHYNNIYETPNMERLAAQGMMFTQAYACSISSPSRVSLFTGMNAARHRVTSWTLRKNTTHEQPDSVMIYPEWNVNGICQEPGVERTTQVTTLAQVLKDNGYHTIHCGKAHFGANNTPGEDPLKMGFEVNIAGHAAGSPASYYGKENFGNKPDGKSPLAAVPGLEKYHGTDTFLSEALTLEAEKALNNAQKSDKPFFLYMAHYAVHTPIQPDLRFYQKYIDKGLPPVEAAYATLIEGMDKSLGDLMDYLKENNLEDNTVILFMSDNGGLAAHTRAGQLHVQNYPLNSGKGSAYEGGVREPMIVSWPGKIKPGSKCNHYLMIEDFFPSILEIAGISDYETIQQRDGISFVPLLTEKGKVQDRDIYWHYPHSWGPSGPGIGATCAIRSGDWKLVYYFDSGKRELFNIANDISEKQDLAGKEPRITKQLAGKLSNYLRSVDAQRPILRKTQQLAPWPDEVK
jgi:arylsulfatase A-like enzyme